MRKFKLKFNLYKYQWQDNDINSHNERKNSLKIL